jgi:hypothetical protein
MQPRSRYKPIKVSFVLFLTLTILFLSLPTNNKAEAYQAPTCGQVINSIDNERGYIQVYLNEYKRITENVIPSPLFAEYLEYWKDAAKKELKNVEKALEWLRSDMQQLFNCEDNNPYWKQTTNDLENILTNLLLLMGGSYAMTEIDWGSVDAVGGVNKIIHNIKKLSERDKYENLYEHVVLENESTRTIASKYTENLLLSLGDRISYRLDSYNDKADSELSKLANLVVLSDGVNIFRGHLADYLKSQSPKSDSLKPDSPKKLSPKSFLFDYSLSNIVNMAPRAMYMTYFEQQLAVPYISASDTAFRKDLSGNLASFMVSTDLISFGLAYSELVLDTYDYIDKEISAVFDKAKSDIDAYKLAQQEITYKVQTLEKVSVFSNKIHNLYYEETINEQQLRKKVKVAYDELELDIKNVYKLDPNVIKLYINGKPIDMPEPAYISKGTTMVPLRVISEELGVKPIWNGKTQTITFSTNHSPMSPSKPIDIVLTVGSKRVAVGSFTEYVSVAPTVKNGTTFVPLAFIANHLGLDSVWESGSKSVILKNRSK